MREQIEKASKRKPLSFFPFSPFFDRARRVQRFPSSAEAEKLAIPSIEHLFLPRGMAAAHWSTLFFFFWSPHGGTLRERFPPNHPKKTPPPCLVFLFSREGGNSRQTRGPMCSLLYFFQMVLQNRIDRGAPFQLSSFFFPSLFPRARLEHAGVSSDELFPPSLSLLLLLL